VNSPTMNAIEYFNEIRRLDEQAQGGGGDSIDEYRARSLIELALCAESRIGPRKRRFRPECFWINVKSPNRPPTHRAPPPRGRNRSSMAPERIFVGICWKLSPSAASWSWSSQCLVTVSAMSPVQPVRHAAVCTPKRDPPPTHPLCRFAFVSPLKIYELNPNALRAKKSPETVSFCYIRSYFWLIRSCFAFLVGAFWPERGF